MLYHIGPDGVYRPCPGPDGCRAVGAWVEHFEAADARSAREAAIAAMLRHDDHAIEMETRDVGETYEDGLATWLVGHRIASFDADSVTMKLDDGTVLALSDASDCCAYFTPLSPTVIDLHDNMVTGVEFVDDELVDGEKDGMGPDSFIVRILSRTSVITDVPVDGDATSGYYCQSFNLVVSTPRPKVTDGLSLDGVDDIS